MHASSVLESRAQPNYRARVHQLAFENMNIHPMATAAGTARVRWPSPTSKQGRTISRPSGPHRSDTFPPIPHSSHPPHPMSDPRTSRPSNHSPPRGPYTVAGRHQPPQPRGRTSPAVPSGPHLAPFQPLTWPAVTNLPLFNKINPRFADANCHN